MMDNFCFFIQKICVFLCSIWLYLKEALIKFIPLFFSFYFGFRIFRAQQRSKAATKILFLFEDYIEDIKEIKMNPSLYTYKGYYPHKIPEIAEKKQPEVYPEIPFRIMFNLGQELRKSIIELLTKISGKESVELRGLIKDFLKAAKLLNSCLSSQTGNYSEDIRQETAKRIEPSYKKMLEIFEKMKPILEKMIENKKFKWF